MGTHPRFKEWYGILIAVFIVGLIAGANLWGNASAQSDVGEDNSGGAAGGDAATVHRPADPRERAAIAVEGGAVDVSSGVTVGNNTPGASPGTPSQPVPHFSALNSPVWVSTQGPAQIVDDLIIFGLTEVKGGLINNGAVGAPDGGGGGGGGGGPAPAPAKTLTVARNARSPSSNITAGSTDIDVTTIDFTNPSSPAGDVHVSSLTVTCAGTCTGIRNVKLFDAGNQIGTTVNLTPILNTTTAVATISPTNPWTIPANGIAKTLTIKADVAAAPSTGMFHMDITGLTADPANAGQFALTVSGTPTTGIDRTIVAPPAPPAPPSASIVFDKTSYTVASGGTAEAIITLTAIAANLNVDRIETIPVTVSSNSSSFVANLSETGADTGIFQKTINLGLENTTSVPYDLRVSCGGDTILTKYPNVAPQTNAAASIAAPACGPDLIVTTPITITPAAPLEGNSVTFSATVKNQGLISGTASTTNAKIDGVTIASNANTGALGINATESESWAWTATKGDHTLEVCADINKTVGEIDENNNCTAPQTFNIALAPTPALAIALAADNPAAQSVQAGTIGITTTKFTLAAANGDVQVTSIKITRSGISADSDLLNVTLVDGATQISSVLSGGKFTFSNLNLTILAGSTKTLSIKTDVKGSAAVGNTFSLSVNPANDVTATAVSSGAAITPTGSALGNIFTVQAPSPTLTLTRQNTPAAGSALVTGTNVTLLEFDAQINTGTANLRQLFIVPKTGISGKITNLKLVNSTTGTTLDSVADSATVRGQNAYSFGYTLSSASNLLSVTTAATRLKVTGDVVCGSATVEDHIIEAVDDVVLREAGVIKQGAPFAQVARSLTACPAPAAPTVSYKCSSGKLYADIAWQTLGKGDNINTATGFWTDFDNEAVTANAFRTGAGQNGFWNTSANYTSAATFSLNQNNKVAPYSLGGFNENGGAAPGPLANLAFRTKYQTRIYYPKTGEHSAIKEFTTPASCSGQTPAIPTFNLTGFSAPAIHGALEAGGFGFNSVLSSDDELFPYRPASEQNESVTLFGSFIPQANAALIQQMQQIQGAPAPVNPVYIFDDLYVYGNGGEPGNVFINGEIVAAPGRDAINLGSNVLLTGNLTVAGNVQAANLTVSNGLTFNGGNLVVGNGDLSVSGNVTAATIGAYYMLEATSQSASTGEKSSQVKCGTGDIIVSCNGNISSTEILTGTLIGGGNTCSTFGKQTSASRKVIQTQAICFNPDRSAPSESVGNKTDL
ncbi:hypothetical protein HYW83_01140 [Candidatus Peregrinibacteria bacterium]|nr:hypothetical protein [Candidatus Peregrinibacteria bacterium]